jgi:hypothetical protein
MRNTIKQVLATLKCTFGDSIFTDPKRFKAALADVPIKKDAEYIRNLLNFAIRDMKAYSRMKAGFNDINFFMIDNLVIEMSSAWNIPNYDAIEMIECDDVDRFMIDNYAVEITWE